MAFWREKGGDIRVCDYTPNDVSSTLIRYNAELGFYDNLDSQVVKYIKNNNLYCKYSELIKKLRENIPFNTFEHCSRTASYALKLNYDLKLGLDYDKVLLSGLLHDCAKALCREKHDAGNIPSDSVGKPVEHQFMGALVARSEYGVDDDEILDAIRYHTTGRQNMSDLQKLIFCADMLEVGRKYDGVDELRKIIGGSLDDGYKACALAQYEFLKEKGGEIYPLTLEAVDEFINN
ncbi:MAG: bis(5'-nucleosyl)-tetraphosphatase (symmetrical) YqeK [Clostridia bacterium]|nr:bis(5'-nucleosyl)-tetraphosphatase (symmetrical) YqeK [Clostridia bacterium]